MSDSRFEKGLSGRLGGAGMNISMVLYNAPSRPEDHVWSQDTQIILDQKTVLRDFVVIHN